MLVSVAAVGLSIFTVYSAYNQPQPTSSDELQQQQILKLGAIVGAAIVITHVLGKVRI